MNDPTPRASGVRAVGFPDQATNPRSRRVRFEEVTPAHEYAAFLSVSIAPLVAHLGLPIFDGYDDLDDLQLAFLTLPSGETVTLGEYAGAPGTSIYIDVAMQNIPQIVFDSCQQLRVSRQEVEWFHPDWQAEIDRLCAEHGGIEGIERSSTAAALSQNNESEPIDCFYHALAIYTREKLPEYWAMLQHNLGLAYFDRSKGERWRNLQKSIECFNKSLEVFTQEKFPAKWQINQEDLSQSLEAWQVEKQNLIRDIFDRPTTHRKLIGVDLSNANLSGAYLRGADLSDADLSGANVDKAQFGNNKGISESMKEYLMARGATFEDSSGDRSESITLVPR
jgi:tetratricopeptide (TPR) repeat protein